MKSPPLDHARPPRPLPAHRVVARSARVAGAFAAGAFAAGALLAGALVAGCGDGDGSAASPSAETGGRAPGASQARRDGAGVDGADGAASAETADPSGEAAASDATSNAVPNGMPGRMAEAPNVAGGVDERSDEEGGAGDGVEASTEGEPASADDAATESDSEAAVDDESEVPAEPLTPPVVYIASDSTVMTYVDTEAAGEIAGWGQMLGLFFDDAVTIANRSIGGRTARRFIDEGRLDDLESELGVGDYLLVQWGTNDGNRNATYELDGQTIPYFLDPATDFKDYLMRYVEVARSREATIVFVTPPPRNSAYCTGGNGTGGHAQAMRELAADEGLALSDLNRKSVDYLQAICPSPTPEDFFLVRPDGSVDGTHFQENGARVLASLVAEGIGETDLPLARFLQLDGAPWP